LGSKCNLRYFKYYDNDKRDRSTNKTLDVKHSLNNTGMQTRQRFDNSIHTICITSTLTALLHFDWEANVINVFPTIPVMYVLRSLKLFRQILCTYCNLLPSSSVKGIKRLTIDSNSYTANKNIFVEIIKNLPELYQKILK
jgi:hypothetical protein